MAGAPFSVNASFSDDETLQLSFLLQNADGGVLDASDMLFEYAVNPSGGPVEDWDSSLYGTSSAPILVTQAGGGITVDLPSGQMIITVEVGRLAPGVYSHGCRFKSISGGKYTQLFDGVLTIAEGEF